jgi:transcription initiation factor IIE alpha subunit
VSEGARDERERGTRALRALLRRTGFRRDRFGEGPESVEIQALEKRIRSVSRREFFFCNLETVYCAFHAALSLVVFVLETCVLFAAAFTLCVF